MAGDWESAMVDEALRLGPQYTRPAVMFDRYVTRRQAGEIQGLRPLTSMFFRFDLEADGIWSEAAGRYLTADDARAELAGKNLMCFCPLDQPCHADVLLELANA